jgi:hypothetical protein
MRREIGKRGGRGEAGRNVGRHENTLFFVTAIYGAELKEGEEDRIFV